MCRNSAEFLEIQPHSTGVPCRQPLLVTEHELCIQNSRPTCARLRSVASATDLRVAAKRV